MGDTHHDPTDHSRTTHQHAGISMKDNFFWPGFVLVALGAAGVVATVAAAAYRHHEWIATTGLIAVIATVSGVLWLIGERRRVTHIERHWFAQHPDRRPHHRHHVA
jgi:protein-S-isoprenylcysteine O-methyltransferase Ste14